MADSKRSGCRTRISDTAAHIGMFLILAVLLAACVMPTPTPMPCLTPTPDTECVALRTRLPLLETRVAESDDVARYLQQTAVALETRCAVMPTMTETPTLENTPTQISTPIAQELCKICTQGGRECAAGFACAYCPALGYRCVDPNSVNGSCNTCRIAAATVATPILRGLATWYGNDYHVGRAMRNGEPYDPGALTCAVPNELWESLRGVLLYVQALNAPWPGVWVRVTDTGYLSEAGPFCYDPAAEIWRACQDGRSIVIDLSPAAHKRLSQNGDTLEVEVWQ